MSQQSNDTYKTIEAFFNEMALKHNVPVVQIDISCYMNTIKVYSLVSNTNYKLLEEVEYK